MALPDVQVVSIPPARVTFVTRRARPQGARRDRPSCGVMGDERLWPVTNATRCVRLCDPDAASVRDHTHHDKR